MRWQAATATRVAAARLTVLFVVGALAWAGLTQSDDRFCAAAASGWAFHFPYLSNSHWGGRHTVVLPIALAFRLFGRREAILAAVPMSTPRCCSGSAS